MALLIQQEAKRHQSSFESLKVNDYDESSGSVCEVLDRDLDESSCELICKEFFGTVGLGFVTHNQINDTADLPNPLKKGCSFSVAECGNSCHRKFKQPSHCGNSIECDDATKWLLDRCDGDVLFMKEVWHIFCHEGQLHLNSMRSAMYENDLDVILFDAVRFAASTLFQTQY